MTEKPLVASIQVTSRHSRAPDRLADELRSAIKAGDREATVQKDGRNLYVKGSICQEELAGILSRTEITHEVEYAPPKPTAEEEKSGKVRIPEDYWGLRSKIESQAEEIQEKYKEIATLNEELTRERTDSKKAIRGLQEKLGNLEAQCAEVPSVQDSVSRMMLFENRAWQTFLKSYDTIVTDYASLGETTLETIEEQVANYIPLRESKEYTSRKGLFDQAVQAREASRNNPFVQVCKDAEELLSELEKLEKRDEAAKQAREDVRTLARGKKIPIPVRTEGDETFITLPFAYQTDLKAYHILERPLVALIESFLVEGKVAGKLDYIPEDSNGLLRYKITGLGTRIRNRLIKVIEMGKDKFTGIGGQKEVIGIQFYKQID